MRDLANKVAVVTGGASGIGRALALSFAGAGMHVAVADVEDEPAARVAAEIQALGVRAETFHTDVSDESALDELARGVFRAFGAAHLICNNAGVAIGGPTYGPTSGDWRWILGVNLEGVIHGCRHFVPRLIAQGQGGHIVNTASMAGMIAPPGFGPYTTTKFAVVGLSEALRQDLEPHGIGVSVLCPAFVRTQLGESHRNRPASLGPTAERDAELDQMIRGLLDAGIEPSVVGERVLQGVRENAPYIFTHPETRALVELRFREILRAFDALDPASGAAGASRP